MKLIRYLKDGKAAYGSLEGDYVKDLKKAGEALCEEGFSETGVTLNLAEIELLAPCLPSKVICLGLNYRSHAVEMNFDLPKVPIIFMKPSTAVIGPKAPIVYPHQSIRVDYEAELAVVIGLKTRSIKAEEALSRVFGYTCGNDVTARDKQPAHGQWTYSKSFDTFCPLGPLIETSIANPEGLSIEGRLNDKVVQSASTGDHIFAVADIIAFVSGCMTLLPGDVIMTGTASGIGPLEVGDRFAVKIEGIGELENSVVGAV